MSEIILRPNIQQKCMGSAIARGLTWDQKTGLSLPRRRGSVSVTTQPQDPSIDPYAAPLGTYYYNIAQRYRSYYARFFNNLEIVNYVIHTRRFAVDFYVPSDFIDFTRFNITAAKVRLYCDSRIPNSHPTTPLKNFSLLCYERGLVNSTRIFDFGLDADTTLYASMNTSPTQSYIGATTISSASSWYEISLNNTAFLGRLQSLYASRGFVGLSFIQSDETDYADFTEDTSVPAYTPVTVTDPPVVQRAYDLDQFTHAHFRMFDGEPSQVPELVITYEARQEAGTIVSMSVTENRSKYSGTAGGTMKISDPEGQNQTVGVEVAYALPGANYGGYISAGSFTAAGPSTSGTNYNWSASISQPIQSGNLLYSQDRWFYESANTTGGSAVYASGSQAWSLPNSASIAAQWGVGRLKPSTNYVFGGYSNRNLTFAVDVSGADPTPVSGMAPQLQFNTGLGGATISVTNNSGLSASASGFYLQEVGADPNDYYYSAKFRARCTEPSFSGDYYYAIEEILVDNRVPTSVVITEANTTDREWQGATASGAYSWTASTSPLGISGYYVGFSAQEFPILSSGNAQFVAPSPRTYNIAAPNEGRWYFSVAPVTNNGIVGNTSSYGFFYNSPENFVEASGLRVNGILVSSNENTWIPSADNPKFEWTPPQPKTGNVYTYELEVGSEGCVVGAVFEWDIDWTKIEDATKAFFKLVVQDSAGIVYMTRATEDSVDNWEWYDGSWHPLEDPNDLGLLESSGATKIRYTTVAGDSVPEKISTHVYLQIGWFDVDGGGIMRYSASLNPISAYFGSTSVGYKTPVVSQYLLSGYTGNLAVKASITPSGGTERLYYSNNTPVGFLWKNTSDASWQQFNGVLGVSGNVHLRLNIEPYMLAEPGVNHTFKWKLIRNGVEDGSWIQTLTNQQVTNPSGSLTWELTDPEIAASGIVSPEYTHGIPLEFSSTTYYSRLRVFDSFQYGEWSKIFKFKVNTPPDAPRGLRIV